MNFDGSTILVVSDLLAG